MTEKVRNVRLYGQLGSRFGRLHRLAVKNPAEAIRALSAMLPGFEQYLMTAKDRGLTFSLFVGKSNISKEEMEYPVGSEDIRIAPVIIGAKRAGVLQTIVGVVLIAIGYFFPPVAAYTVPAGIGMIAGGVIQMLSPVPKGLSSRDSPDNASSYSFNGPVNTQAQGNPVPVLYGRLIVGSAVISAGIRNNEDAYAPWNPCTRYEPKDGMSWRERAVSGVVYSVCKANAQQGQESLPPPDPVTGEYATGGSGGGGSTKFHSEIPQMAQ